MPVSRSVASMLLRELGDSLHPQGRRAVDRGSRFRLDSDIADGCARYRDLLVDQSTFSSVTLEELLDADVLPGRTITAMRSRYLSG
jgi:hypothetical protein